MLRIQLDLLKVVIDHLVPDIFLVAQPAGHALVIQFIGEFQRIEPAVVLAHLQQVNTQGVITGMVGIGNIAVGLNLVDQVLV